MLLDKSVYVCVSSAPPAFRNIFKSQINHFSFNCSSRIRRLARAVAGDVKLGAGVLVGADHGGVHGANSPGDRLVGKAGSAATSFAVAVVRSGQKTGLDTVVAGGNRFPIGTVFFFCYRGKTT